MMHEDHGDWWQDRYAVTVPSVLPEGSPPDAAIGFAGLLQSVNHFDFEQVCVTHSLHLVADGEGTFVVDGTPYRARPGTVCIFYPGQVIRYFDQPGIPWRYYWFFIGGRHVDWVLSLARFSREQSVRQDSDPRLLALAREVLDCLRGGTLAPHMPVSWLWRMIALLTEGVPAHHTPELAHTARTLIDSDFDQALTVDELARRLKVERSTLFRHFQDAYGMSPKHYIDRLRLQKAQTLLMDAERTVEQVSLACGYSDSAYFARRFRKLTGVSPSDWRQQRG